MGLTLDRDRLRELFDLRVSGVATGGGYTGDPAHAWNACRRRAAVLAGTPHELAGYTQPLVFAGIPEPDRPHFTAFTFAACDDAFRNAEVFASSASAVDFDGDIDPQNSMLSMGGGQHRRYRALVQPSFVPAKARWWLEKWVDDTTQAVIDGFVDDGRADLNTDFCAIIPVLTITGSFGVPLEQALEIRAALENPNEIVPLLAPIVADRRESPQDDLISVLVEAEVADEDGVAHRLSDGEIYSFAALLLAAGSGTTWRQLGITLIALLTRPALLDAVRADRSLVRHVIDEVLRLEPTNPAFARWLTRDVEFHGAHLPKGAVLHLCMNAANRDPARWDRPDELDVDRAATPSLAFGGGPHVCLGMHLARAEMTTALNALLDRLPDLRLDPDAAPPQVIGLYHRGTSAVPVLFG